MASLHDEMAESHAKDGRIVNANRELADAIDRWLELRVRIGKAPLAVEAPLGLAHEKLLDENAQIVRVWD